MNEKKQSNKYQPQHQPKYLQSIMDKNPDWKISDSEYDLKQDIRKKGHLCVISESILADSEVISRWCITLTVSNDLSDSEIRLGTNYYDKTHLPGFWYSWDTINTVIILVHQ